MQSIQVGLLGLGTVGTGVVHILQQQGALLAQRLGAQLTLAKVATRRPERERAVRLADGQVTSDVMGVIEDPNISIIVELIGGYEPARTYILAALAHGKHVVTANKAVLARHGPELFDTAQKRGVDIGFEASVGGGIPIIRTIKEAFVANAFLGISSIINGTTNYILTRMSEQALGFDEALKEAQDLGYAEADPTFDIEGIDAAQKLALLASLAFGTWIPQDQVYTEGIAHLTQLDIAYARELGYCVKLLALAKRVEDALDVRVHPALVAAQNELASVQGAYNAVLIQGDMVGRNMLVGRGAGALPTASAVVGDVVDVARNILTSSSGRVPPQGYQNPAVDISVLKPIDAVTCKYYLRFQVLDRPGVLSDIAGILGREGISLESVIQKGRGVAHDDTVSVVMMTHEARERHVRQALEAIETLPSVQAKTMRIRVEESGET
jgi:homoserine dehydrogenase